MSEQTTSTGAQRIADGTAWREFCDRLKQAGEHLLVEGNADDPLHRAEGVRYLTRLVRAGLEAFVEYSDPLAPELRRTVHETIKMGADNPDNYYQNAPVHGDCTYVLEGTRGTVHYLSIATQQGHYGQGGNMPPAGFVESQDLHIEADGHFRLYLGGEPSEPNWLPLAPGLGTLIVRQTFLDRDREQRAELTLRRVGGPATPPPLTVEAVDQGLTTAANLVNACAMLFPGWARGFRKHTNQLPKFDPNMARMFGGDPNIVYYHSHFELEDDEALVIEVTPPACDYWNFQLNNFWMESLDYRHHRVVINSSSAQLEDDGSVRVVVAGRDPGCANWLDTAGHREGTMCWRWVRAQSEPQPQTRVVKLSELT